MNRNEIINRNIGLSFDFLRQILGNPALMEKIPSGSTLQFVEKDFSILERKEKRRRTRQYLRVKTEMELVSANLKGKATTKNGRLRLR